MTTRDHARRSLGDAVTAASARPSPRRSSRAARRCPDRLAAARERKGVDLMPRRARHEDPGSLPERARARRLARAARARSTRRASCGTTRSTSASTRRTSSGSGDASAATRSSREPVIVPPRPIQEPPRPLTFSPSIVVAALLHRRRRRVRRLPRLQLLRFAKPPDAGRHGPRDGRRRRSTTRRPRTPRRHVDRRRDVSDHGARPGPPYRATAPRRRTWSDRRRPPSRPQPVRHHRHGPGHRQAGRTAADGCSSPCRSPWSRRRRSRSSQPADGTTSRTARSRSQGTTTNATTVTVAASFLGPVRRGRAPPQADGAAHGVRATRLEPRSPRQGTTVTVADDGSFRTGVELTAGRWAITVTATSSARTRRPH